MTDSIERIADDMDEAAEAYAGHHSSGTFRRLATRLRALSPAGGDWVVIPTVPTEALLYAIRRAKDERDAYARLIAASPQQEPGAGDGGPQCSTHPDAPHGFDRNGSHNNGRYKCDCEGWAPPSRLEEAAALLGRARLALNEGECDLHYHDERGVRRSLVERIDSYLSRECGNA